jgi:hypothetical protein
MSVTIMNGISIVIIGSCGYLINTDLIHSWSVSMSTDPMSRIMLSTVKARKTWKLC